jgi:hypothetical protein
MVDPVVSFLGVESGDPVGHKRFLALFSGGMLPIISLSFLHMLVKFEEEEKKKTSPNLDIPLEELATIIGKEEAQVEEQRYKPTEEDLEELKRQLQKFESTDEEPREDKIKRLVYSKRDA